MLTETLWLKGNTVMVLEFMLKSFYMMARKCVVLELFTVRLPNCLPHE